MNLYLFIAKKFSYKSAARGKLSIISNIIATASVTISVAVIIVAIAVANGFRDSIRQAASGFSGDIILSAPGVDVVNHLYPIEQPPYLAELTSLNEIESVNAVAYRSAILKSKEHIHGALLKGVDSLCGNSFFAAHLLQGTLPDYSDTLSADILISSALADELKYGVNDKLFVYFVEDEVTFRIFNICGIYDAAIEELGKKIIIADIRQIRSVNQWGDNTLSGYELLLKKRYKSKSEAVAAKIENIIMEQTPEGDSFALLPTTVEQKYYILCDWLRLLDINVIILLSLMIAVAGFNMISGQLIILFERISHIGLLKALGMRSRNIVKIFLYRSSFIVLRGFLIGNVISLAFCILESKFKFVALDAQNYFVDHVPIYIEWHTVLLVNVAAFSIIMAILLVPCNLISKVSPATTLVVK